MVAERTSYSGYETDETTPVARRAAIALLIEVQRNIPLGVFDPRSYWDIFENRIRAAAIQNVDIVSFFEQLKRKLKIGAIRHSLPEITHILAGHTANPIDVLAEIRKHLTLIVMYVRIEQEARKVEYEAKPRQQLTPAWEFEGDVQ